jgi:hypothetical protein
LDIQRSGENKNLEKPFNRSNSIEKTTKYFYPRLGASNRSLGYSVIYFGGLSGLQYQGHAGDERIERAHPAGGDRR